MKNNWKKTIISGAGIITYIILKRIAKFYSERKDIDNDNPYINKHVFQINVGIYEGKIKPAIDQIISFCSLIILSPIYIIISLAIIIDDPGPVFFTQKRIGKDKHYIQIHKFRSMAVSTPHDIPTHQLTNPEQYITRVGKILRRTSLDELPQIWDIFRGRMSIIGPRPALWNQADLIEERDKYNANTIMPGLTGLAQIKGRDELEIPIKAKFDGDYAEKLRKGGWRAFIFDCQCFFATVFNVLRGDGVVEGGTGTIQTNLIYLNNKESIIVKNT